MLRTSVQRDVEGARKYYKVSFYSIVKSYRVPFSKNRNQALVKVPTQKKEEKKTKRKKENAESSSGNAKLRPPEPFHTAGHVVENP